jgi:hypothetical protein
LKVITCDTPRAAAEVAEENIKAVRVWQGDVDPGLSQWPYE